METSDNVDGDYADGLNPRLPMSGHPSLRDFFAAHALAGLSGETWKLAVRAADMKGPPDDAKAQATAYLIQHATMTAYMLADAMLVARERKANA